MFHNAHAKGLEFENVYVIGAGEEILPHEKTCDIEDDDKKELLFRMRKRRETYVAVTERRIMFV